jgi:hypothetical protein
MTDKIKKLTEVEPGEKSELNPEGDFVHPEMQKHMPSPQNLAKAKLLQAKMDKLQKQLEKLQKAQQKAHDDKWKTQRERESLVDIDPKIVQIASLIKRDCSYALQSMEEAGSWLYRGIKGNPPNIFTGKPRENRWAKDSNDQVQKDFDGLLKAAGFNALRSNSIFCSGRLSQATGYGDVFMIFPKDGFTFTWSPKYLDLYSDLLSNLYNTGVQSLFHTTDYEEAKNALRAHLWGLRSLLGEIDYILDVRVGKSWPFEDFLSLLDLTNKPELQSIALKIFKNRPVVMSTLRKVQTSIRETIDLLVEAKNPEDEANFDASLTQIIQVLRRLDGIKLIPVFSNELTYYKINNSNTFIDTTFLNIIKTYNTIRNEALLTPEQIVKNKLEFDNTDFTKAIASNNEICVSGEYYAINRDAYGDTFEKLFGISSNQSRY